MEVLRFRHTLLRTGAHDGPQMARALGVLYLSGALLILVSSLLPHPEGAREGGLAAIVGIGIAGGSSCLIGAKHARVWMVHAVLAFGTACISLSIFFAGDGAGVNPFMFVWVVLMASAFFPGRAVAAHLAWILVSWAVALALVAEVPGFAPVTRWTLGSLVLLVTAAVLSELVAGRRAGEQELRREVAERERLQAKLEHMAHHDPLTGVANRWLLEVELDRELARAGREGSALSLIAVDLDGFKAFNDRNGHSAGDRLLKLVTAQWSAALRGQDLIARVGGDEFVVLLSDCDAAKAEVVAGRLAYALPQEQTCSTGIASWDGREGSDDLMDRADQAMYADKLRASARPASPERQRATA
jgi:diguanylate cyclase (GGDEF)-like protein